MSQVRRPGSYRWYQYLDPGRDYRALDLAAEVGRVAAYRLRLIDISHSGDRTCLDVIATRSRPVLITHAGPRTVWTTG